MNIRKLKKWFCLALSVMTLVGEAGNVTTLAAETTGDDAVETVDTDFSEQDTEAEVEAATEEAVEDTEAAAEEATEEIAEAETEGTVEETEDTEAITKESIKDTKDTESEDELETEELEVTTASSGSSSGSSSTTTTKITGLKQTSDTAQSVKVEWNATGKLYTVEWSSDNTKWISADVTSQTSCEIKNLTAGKKYYVRVYVSTDTTTAATVEVFTKPTAKTASVSQINDKTSTTSTTVQWDAVEGANGYKVEYKPDIDGATKVTKYVTTNKIKLTKLSENTKYFVYVYAYTGNDTYKAVSTSWKKLVAKLKPTQVSGLKCDIFYTKEGPRINANKVSNANGYHWIVYKYNGSSKKYDKKVEEGKSSSNVIITSEKVAVGQFYMAKVRAYTTINNKKVYGKWSNVIYMSGDPKEVKVKNASTSSQKVSWSSVKRATSYTVYVSKDKNSRGKKICTTTKTNVTCKKYGNNKLKEGTVYYYTIVANMKVGDKTYKSTPYFRYSKRK